MAEYLFIDESGDPGYILLDGASSKHYAELALQLNGDSLSGVIAHMISWKYVLGKLYEAKDLPRGEQCQRYLAPILELHHQGKLKCSCVHLFRNYILDNSSKSRCRIGIWMLVNSLPNGNGLRLFLEEWLF